MQIDLSVRTDLSSVREALNKSVRGECFPFASLDTPRCARHSGRTGNVSNHGLELIQRFLRRYTDRVTARSKSHDILRSVHLYAIRLELLDTIRPELLDPIRLESLNTVRPELVEGTNGAQNRIVEWLAASIKHYKFNPIMVRQADETTSHSTRPSNDESQVAGYHHERIKTVASEVLDD